ALHTPREGHPVREARTTKAPRAVVASGRGAWLSLQEHGAATPRAYRGGKETARAVGVFADAGPADPAPEDVAIIYRQVIPRRLGGDRPCRAACTMHRL